MLRHENANFYLTEYEYNTIKEIHSLIEAQALESSSITIKDIDKAFKSKNKSYDLRVIINKLSSNKYNRYSQLLKVYLYVKLNNIGAFEREITNLLNMTKYSKNRNLEQKDTRKYFQLLGKISELENGNKLYNLYLLSEINSSDELFESPIQISMSFSQSSFYEKLLSPTFALIYPRSWSRWAYNNLERKKYKRIYKKINFNHISQGQLSSLRYYRSLGGESLDIIRKRLNTLSAIDQFEEKEMFFRIMGNVQLRSDLKSKKLIKLSSFGKKRDFYRKNLKNFIGIEYNVFNLFSLGDISREYFIYALAVRTYGLPSTKLLQIK